jgi:hypothetical protein
VITTNTVRYAKRYCELGLALTWTAPGAKGPRHAGWNRPEHAITAPAGARHHGAGRGLHALEQESSRGYRNTTRTFGPRVDRRRRRESDDPLASEHALDSFDVFRLLEHQGDNRAAVREAARLLGLQGDQT